METFLWVENYRPKKISECILPDTLKSTFQEFVNKGHIPNLLLSGGAGVGKTTVAKAMLEEIGADYIMINGSEESGIDTLRTKMKNFASTVSLSGGRKFIILDEADYLNPQSTQPALRGMIEEFHKNCGFILTCNFKNRIIDPIHSRCSVIEFAINSDDKPKMAAELFDRCKNILIDNEIGYEPKVVAEVINKHFPDNRRVLNELQRYSSSGRIDAGILVNISEDNIKALVTFMKDKEFGNVRKWIVQNIDNDPVKVFRKIYNASYDVLEPRSIPRAVLSLADYQYKSAFVADQEINLLACLTEIMMECEFK